MLPCNILNYKEPFPHLPTAISLIGSVEKYTNFLNREFKKPVANNLANLLTMDQRFITFIGGNDCYFHMDSGTRIMTDIWDFLLTLNEDLASERGTIAKSYFGKIINAKGLNDIVDYGNKYYALTTAQCDLSGLELVEGTLENNIGWFKLTSQEAYKREGSIMRNCIGSAYKYTEDRTSEIWVFKSTKPDRNGVCKSHLAIMLTEDNVEIEELLTVNNKPPPIHYFDAIQNFINLLEPSLDFSYSMFEYKYNNQRESTSFRFSNAEQSSPTVKAQISYNIFDNFAEIITEDTAEICADEMEIIFSEDFCYLTSLLIGEERTQVARMLSNTVKNNPFVPHKSSCIPLIDIVDYNSYLKFFIDEMTNTDLRNISSMMRGIAIFSSLCDPEFNGVLSEVLYDNILVSYIHANGLGENVPKCMYATVVPRIIGQLYEVFFESSGNPILCHIKGDLKQAIFNAPEYDELEQRALCDVNPKNLKDMSGFFADDKFGNIVIAYIEKVIRGDFSSSIISVLYPLKDKCKLLLYTIRELSPVMQRIDDLIYEIKNLDLSVAKCGSDELLDTFDTLIIYHREELFDLGLAAELIEVMYTLNIKSKLFTSFMHEINDSTKNNNLFVDAADVVGENIGEDITPDDIAKFLDQ